MGRVKTTNKKVNGILRNGKKMVLCKRILKEKMLNQTKHKKTGYMMITFSKENKKTTFLMHRLVLNAFLPTNKNFHVNHKNLIKHDNRLENLEWVTQSENMQHAVTHGRMHTEKHMQRYKNLIGNSYARKTNKQKRGKNEC